jgi:hypothetical protein
VAVESGVPELRWFLLVIPVAFHGCGTTEREYVRLSSATLYAFQSRQASSSKKTSYFYQPSSHSSTGKASASNANDASDKSPCIIIYINTEWHPNMTHDQAMSIILFLCPNHTSFYARLTPRLSTHTFPRLPSPLFLPSCSSYQVP